MRESDIGKAMLLGAAQIKPSNTFSIEGLDIKDKLAEKRGEYMKDLITIPLYDGNP